MSIRHKNLIPIAMLGFIGFSALPFSPTWQGTALYYHAGPSLSITNPILYYIFSIAFLLIHSMLLAGFIRHLLRGVFPSTDRSAEHVERWVWFLQPIGLLFIIVTHFLIGLFMLPNLEDLSFSGWILGAVAVLISGVIWYLPRRSVQGFPRRDQSTKASPLNLFFSFEWLYRLLWRLFRALARLIAFLSTILEGEGGILWALVLFALIFVFLQR